MLPPYPQPVTDIIPVVTERSPEALVKAILSLPVQDPRYIRDQYGTKCNFYTTDLLHILGLRVVVAKANELRDRWLSFPNADKAMEVDLQGAVSRVNKGFPVAGTLHEEGHGHVFPVLPQAPVAKLEDLIISNVGASNFYGRSIIWAIPLAKLAEVRFVTFP